MIYEKSSGRALLTLEREYFDDTLRHTLTSLLMVTKYQFFMSEAFCFISSSFSSG